MARLEQEATSDCSNPILDIFFKLLGVPVDVNLLEYQIFEQVTSPPTLIQVFPPSGRATVDLAACPTGHKLDTGHYVAEWTVPAAEPIGTHIITWFYEQNPGSPERQFQEEFEVLAAGVPSSGLGYCTVQQLRDEGLTVAAISDADLTAIIERASLMVDMYTGRWFTPRARVVTLDGRNAPTMFLGFPIVLVNSLTIDGTVLLVDEFTTYNRHLTEGLLDPDDRENPRLELEQPREGTLLFRQTLGRRVFPKGQRNIVIDGDFGYTDWDGSATGKTPDLICHATKLIVMREMWRMFDEADDRDDAARRRFITTLKTRDQTIQYANPGQAGFGRQGVGPFTGDPEIDSILMQFRRPIRIGSSGGANV